MTRWRRNTVGLIALLAALTALTGLVRAGRLRSPQVRPGQPAAIALDLPAASERLAALVRLPTISWGDVSKRDADVFDRVQPLLAASFPRVRQALTHEHISRWSLL